LKEYILSDDAFYLVRFVSSFCDLFVLSNDDHHAHAGQKSDDLEDRLLPLDADQKFGNDGDGRDVDEAAGGEGQDVGGGGGLADTRSNK